MNAGDGWQGGPPSFPPTSSGPADRPEEDAVERSLRGALHRQADRVQPGPDGFARISRLIDDDQFEEGVMPETSDPSKWWLAGVAAAAVIGTTTAVLFLGGDGEPTTLLEGTKPTMTTTPSVPSEPTEPAPSATTAPPAEPGPTAAAPELEAVPVYWLGDSKASTHLYREFLTVPDSGGVVLSAVRAAMAGTPLDPDYRTPWAAPSRVEVSQDGDAITIDLSADAFGTSGLGSEQAAMAVQQLVYTATAAAQTPGPVTILVDGGAYDAWGAVALGEPMTRDPDAPAQVWIDTPQEGATVSAGTVEVTGVAVAFEANINWAVRTLGGALVEEGYTMAGAYDREPYTFTVELSPGTYEISVWSEDMSDGMSPEGQQMFEQTRTVVVE